jgi:anti-sigma28 factor (negative regulator of flagellin synthesis)
MTSVEELRAEARRLREASEKISDPQTKRELASRAFELAQRAEALANGVSDPEILRANIERYRSLLASGTLSIHQQRIVREMLDDAETLQAAVPKKTR